MTDTCPVSTARAITAFRAGVEGVVAAGRELDLPQATMADALALRALDLHPDASAFASFVLAFRQGDSVRLQAARGFLDQLIESGARS